MPANPLKIKGLCAFIGIMLRECGIYPNRWPIALTIFVVGNNNSNVLRSEDDETIAKLAKEIMLYYKNK